MKQCRSFRILVAIIAMAMVPAAQVIATPAGKVAWAPAVKAKPMAKTTLAGLNWLVQHQMKDGGWGQGEESNRMGRGMAHLTQRSNVADSTMAILALLRSGSSPTQGKFKTAVNRGINFILSEIEASDKDSIWVTSVRGTRVQGKIGPHVGTFLSAQLLAEIKGRMGAKARNTRVEKALDKVLAKMDGAQTDAGGYAGRAWAPALSQAIANKAVNRAYQKGAKVTKRARVRSAKWAKKKVNRSSGDFDASGSAGVRLYAAATAVGSLNDTVQSEAIEEEAIRSKIAQTGTETSESKAALKRIKDTRALRKVAQKSLTTRLQNPRFVAGFGSNGGEEFLSYMMVSESLVSRGGAEWIKWDTAMATNLGRVQNGDGSWTGHHCITGRTFCTAAALLVLLADRATVPLARKVQHG